MHWKRQIAISLVVFFTGIGISAQTKVGIRGSKFTINGQVTYTAASGFPSAKDNIEGTLLNVRAVQAIFDDANYLKQGSRSVPYDSPRIGPIAFDYPDGPFSADRNLNEFLKALPTWRNCGVLAFAVNLQGGGPTDGNFSTHIQPQWNSAFDPKGNLKPAYAKRLQRVIEKADKLGMVVVVGYFYQGTEGRIEPYPDDKYVQEAIRQASTFLRSLPNRNVMIEIANEVGKSSYPNHPWLQPEGIIDSVRLAQVVVHHEIPVSFSWIGDPPQRGTRGFDSLRAVDFVMFHTNRQSAEGVHERITAYRKLAGYDRPMLINEDEVTTFNLQAATDERVGWGYYDQGLNDYHNGFQSVPVDWGINTLTKWMFFNQVARLSGSPAPRRPQESDLSLPTIRIIGLNDGDTVKRYAHVEAVVDDHGNKWPIRRVEFFVDGIPYTYTSVAPFAVGGQQGWDIADLSPGKHILWVVAYEPKGPAFTEVCSMVEISFNIGR